MQRTIITVGCLCVWMSASAFAAADAAKGKDAFEGNCSVCHNPESDERKVISGGPGLKGLFKRPTLINKKKVTEGNVTNMINEGGNGMPPFADQLTAGQKADIVAYLKTL